MIAKSRLEELKKENAFIFYLLNNSISIIKLDDNYNISVDEYNKINNCKPTLYHNRNGIFQDICEMDKIFETEKDAKWALKYHATRTEYLDLPSWEELIDKKKNRRFYINEFVCRNEYDLLVVCSLGVDFEGKIEIRNVSLNHKLLFQAPLSEENYIKACDLCLNLFKGESDEESF